MSLGAVRREGFLCLRRRQEFYKALRGRALWSVGHQHGGVGQGTLEITRQRTQELDAGRGRDQRYRTRRHVIALALQHGLENSKWRGAHDLGFERFGNPQPLKDFGKSLSRFDAVEDKEVRAK